MAKHSPKLEAGDLLAIPLGEGRFAIGQILLPGVNFYLAVDPTTRDTLAVPDEFNARLFAWTNDAEVYRGNWRKLAGRLPVSTDFPRPDFKVEIDAKLMVESFEGQLLRELVAGQDDDLNYRTSFSPLLVQDAVQAFNGYGPWLSSFDKMRPPESEDME